MDAGLSCSMPVTCSDAKLCDWTTAQKLETWCGSMPLNDLPSPARIAQCDDGYASISIHGTDSGVIYYYRDHSLVAVITNGIGSETCSQGPPEFRTPKCEWIDLCPRTRNDASEDAADPTDGAVSDTTTDISSG